MSSQKNKSTFNNIYENISNQTLNHFNKLNQFTQGIALLTVLNKKSDPQKIKENVLTSIKIYIANLNYSNTIIEDYIHENLEDIDVKTLEGAYKFARTYNTFIDWLKTLPVIA